MTFTRRELPLESESRLMQVGIRAESTDDRDAIRRVNQLAFGGDDEANLVESLRDGGFIMVSLVAEADGEIVGHILFSRVAIITSARVVDALALAPMSVLPSHQRLGIGSKLVAAGLDACRKRHHRIVVVLGHPEYYPRFGFSSQLARPLESPFGGGEAWMAIELVPGALDGVQGRVEFPAPFTVFE